MPTSQQKLIVLGNNYSYANKVKTIFGNSLVDYRQLNEGVGISAYDSSPKLHPTGTISGATWTPGAGFDGGPALLFDGVNDYIDIYKPELNSDFNGQECSIGFWLKVSSAAVWTNGSTGYATQIKVDNNNVLYLAKVAPNNTFEILYKAGGTAKTADIAISSIGWMFWVLTASKQNDRARIYVGGAQAGPDLTGLGTWTGALLSTSVVIGAQTNSGAGSASGYIRDFFILNREATLSEIQSVSQP